LNLGFAAENEAETPLRRLAETPSTRFCPLAHHAHSPSTGGPKASILA
jgi:hypothetical protein